MADTTQRTHAGDGSTVALPALPTSGAARLDLSLRRSALCLHLTYAGRADGTLTDRETVMWCYRTFDEAERERTTAFYVDPDPAIEYYVRAMPSCVEAGAVEYVVVERRTGTAGVQS